MRHDHVVWGVECVLPAMQHQGAAAGKAGMFAGVQERGPDLLGRQWSVRRREYAPARQPRPVATGEGAQGSPTFLGSELP